MLKTYFKCERTREYYSAGTAGRYLDAFAQWFEENGYQRQTIRRRIVGAAQFAGWVEASGWTVPELDSTILDAFGRHLAGEDRLRCSSGDFTVRFLAARHFLHFLQVRGIAAAPAVVSTRPAPPAMLCDFRAWMLSQRGVSERTLNGYHAVLLDLLKTLGEQAELFTAKGLREFVLERVHRHNPASARNVVTAVRMLVRFLIATDRCEPGLYAAIPTIAAWRLSTLPRYLPSEDVERVIGACDVSTPRGARDKAVILLLARLGLRASDVAGLSFDDIEWRTGTLMVTGKNRRQARLPLPQEVGDALLYYLEHGRPHARTAKLFISTLAPLRPLAQPTISQIAARALRRAGIDAPVFGAHVFRHSLATTMLRQGASLEAIGEVLRHASVETTAHYAKVDHPLLQTVALPWPEVE